MKNHGLDSDNNYSFIALRGIQAEKEYYAIMCPLKLVPQIFLFDEVILPPELRAQRILNKARIPEMASYLVNNHSDYIFSSMTASVDGDIRFEPLQDEYEELAAQGVELIDKPGGVTEWIRA